MGKAKKENEGELQSEEIQKLQNAASKLKNEIHERKTDVQKVCPDTKVYEKLLENMKDS